MQKWNPLPTEIINQIIIYVDKNDDLQERQNDLSQCALTCRSWRETAQSLLFSKIKLKNFERASESLLRLMMMNNSKLGTYVKELDSLNSDYRVSLIAMDFLFPNLDKVLLEWDDISYRFFYKLITEEGKFRNLKSIPPPEEDYKHVDMYIECLFALKSQITEVYLEDDDEEGCTYLKLCDELYQFPKLQIVSIHQSSNASSRNIMDYVEAITAHDNLLYLGKLNLIVSGQNHLRLPFKELRDVQPSTKIKDITITVVNSETCGALNEQCMLYIMKKFPNPRQFRLLVARDYGNLSLTANERSQEYTTSVLQFLQYLCKIQDCRVSNIILTNRNTASLIKDLLSSISLQTKIKLPQIHITGNEYTTEENNSNNTYIGVKNNVVDGAPTIFIAFNKNDTTRFEQQLLNLFQEAGCLFTEVTLKIDTVGELVSSLNHIGKYCDKLEKIVIDGHDLRENPLTVSEEISDEAKNYSVKKLCISGFGLTPDQLRFISAYFPCLENLILDNFFSIGNENGQAFSTLLDNTLLKYIQIKTDGIAKFSGLSGIHIDLTTDAGQNYRISLITERELIKKTCYHFFLLIEYDHKILNSDRDTNWVNWHIHCKSIEKVDIIFPTIAITKSGTEREVPQTITLSF